MLKILKFAKQYWYMMLVILGLLFVQAYCELSLPEYTSNIVDVGIQERGIESPVPEKMRAQTYDHLLLFMNEEETEIFTEGYETADGEIYTLKEAYSEAAQSEVSKKTDEETKEYIEQLKSLLSTKETLLMMLSSEGEQADAMKEAFYAQMGVPAGTDLFEVFAMMPKEAVLQISEALEEQLSEMADTIGDSTAISFVAAEYEAMGTDVDGIQMDYLKHQGIMMLLIAFGSMIAAVCATFFSARLAAKVSMNLRGQVYDKVVKFSNAELNKFSTASLITRCTNDIQQVQMVLTMMFRIVLYAPIMALGGISKVAKTESGMGWIIVVAVVAVFSLVGILMAVAMPKFRSMQNLVDRLNLVSREMLTGIPVIRAFSREKHEEKRFDEASRDLQKTQLFTNSSMAFMMPAMMFIMNAITVLIVWVGAHGVDTGSIQVGSMMAFITYTMQIVMSFLMITMVSIMLPRAAVAAGRIEEVLKTEVSIDNKKQVASLAKEGKVQGVVAFEHVSFAYPGADENALEDIDFVANPGETTAIIGSTGCGKSSLVQLIPRLFDVSKGRITIDGTDIRDVDLKELRQNIGYVPQKGVLFSGTIESNIAFGQGDIDTDAVEEAAQIAQASEFIQGKEEKFKSRIAQGGANVSGGQKQRLAIARALAKKPQILVFDDSFSALDYKTDKTLRKELHEKTRNATVIIVAQRISTILHADKILVLDDGRIAGCGTHKELLKSNEVYRQIAQSQLSEKEINETLNEAETEKEVR